MSEDEHAVRFDARYRVTNESAFLEIERAVLGVDYQATGYTTRSEADELGRRLELGPASRLLDLGSGCGFPGLYLAARTGCSVVTVDPIATGAAAARARARKDGMAERHLAVIGRGQALPVRTATFDAIVHVDATC
jgi:cyclopropane fatty-acyl-phospholipid synthase-like methyltransferase